MDENTVKSTGTQNVSTKKKKRLKTSKAERKRLRLLAAMQLKKRLMTEQLYRELELTKNSTKHGKLQWEKVCKDIKVKEFQEEIQEWSERSDSLLEKKDEKINSLIKNIEETQDMSERIFSQHLDQLEYLTECHQVLCRTATELHDEQASELIVDFFGQLSRTQEVQDRVKINSENIMHATNVITKNRLMAGNLSFMEHKFDQVTSEIEKRYSLRDNTLKKMKGLQAQLLNWMTGLDSAQRQRTNDPELNKLNDIERTCRKNISDLQQELLSIESEWNRKIYGYKLEQAYFLETRLIIKNSFELSKKMTHEKMLKTSSESYKTIERLKEFVRYGELLLGLVACCRKYQTQKEKVIPFGNDNNFSSHLEDTEKMRFEFAKLLDLSKEDIADQINFFKNFWRRCSDVRYHNLLLKEEKFKLTQENEKYRNIIRSMNISSDAEYILEALTINQTKEIYIFQFLFFFVKTKKAL